MSLSDTQISQIIERVSLAVDRKVNMEALSGNSQDNGGIGARLCSGAEKGAGKHCGALWGRRSFDLL